MASPDVALRAVRHCAPTLFIGLALVAGAGCGGGGPYGHLKTYAPLDAEDAAIRGAEDWDPVMVKRQPEQWKAKTVSLFGVVTTRQDVGSGAYLVLSVRTLELRNACETSDEDSCRTTVSDHEHDKVHATVAFATPTDREGAESVGVGSLLRVVGNVIEPDPSDGLQVVRASYYRHWPRGYYRTSAAKEVLRR